MAISSYFFLYLGAKKMYVTPQIWIINFFLFYIYKKGSFKRNFFLRLKISKKLIRHTHARWRLFILAQDLGDKKEMLVSATNKEGNNIFDFDWFNKKKAGAELGQAQVQLCWANI